MSQAELDLVRRYYATWNSGDMDALIAALDPEVEWHGHPRLPEPGPYRSPDEVKRWMGQFREAWGELAVEPVELIDAGDAVVALVRVSATGRESGIAVQGGVDAHVLKLDGDRLVFFRIYAADGAVDRAALGPDEREVLELRVQAGMTEAEIAGHLGVSTAEVSSLIERSRQKLGTLA